MGFLEPEPHIYSGTPSHPRDEAIRWLKHSPQALVMHDMARKIHLAHKWGKAIADEVWLLHTRKLI